MASFVAKKVMRTYSRQTKRSIYNGEPPTKRRRVESAAQSIETAIVESSTDAQTLNTSSPPRECSTPPPSSPKDSPAIFSDEPPRSSPPSSPTPRSSPTPPRRDDPDNAQTPPKAGSKKKHMVQMQLDLASETRKTCKTCGMQYIPSNAEDAALHKKFHAMNLGGVDFTKAVIERFRKNEVWSGGGGSFIAVVGRRDGLALRNRASDVLKVVTTELAAVPISDEELWSQTKNIAMMPISERETKTAKTDMVAKDEGALPLFDRFKVYLYFQGNKCIGACLAERIWEAYSILEPAAPSGQSSEVSVAPQSSSISISNQSGPAILGISRIWTSNQHRKKGIATRLLDCASSDFLYGFKIDKAKVAFSQPTESGGNLARKWFSSQAGWHVYMD
ncbi:hypothetical protein PTNB73_09117 [Pyrenophora teres f. teres]|nr:hypothetical protein PTNB73_09117 [Pyrenophora teres f. teres]